MQVKKARRTDPNRLVLIQNLKTASKQHQSNIWARVASDLSKSNRNRTVVNLSRLSRTTSPGDIVVIPGKVLGSGVMAHSLDVAAEAFSTSAQEKITQSGGQCLTIPEMVARDPNGSNIKLIK